MTDARLLTADGGYVTTLTVPDGIEPPDSYQFSDHSFQRERGVEVADGSTVWIYRGPPASLPPEPPPIELPDDIA